MANKFSRYAPPTSEIISTTVTDPETGQVIASTSKKKFTRNQPTTQAYIKAIAKTAPLTMLTAAETRQLAKAGEKETAADEAAIFKYREEFLHIQKVSENGITSLGLLISDTAEFKQVATNWGFVTVVENRYKTDVVVGKNLAQTEVKTLVSTVTVNWNKPKKPTIDVEYYRQSGNIVNTEAVQAKISPLDVIKEKYKLGIYPATALADTDTEYVKPDEYETFAVSSANYVYAGAGTGAQFRILVSALAGAGQAYQFGRAGSAGGGQNYTQGELIRVPGTGLGGTSPDDDAVITILNVNNTGAIVSATVAGTASDGFISRVTGLTLDPGAA
jgi:hypothetical protein